jgi:hypothetical protein
MTKTEMQRRQHLNNALTGLGFTVDEVEKLRKISNTLRRWFERECGTDGGAIERDEETGKPFFRNDRGRRWPVPDLEAGAEKRLAAIMAARNGREAVPLATYIQTDPRGAALYILRQGDVPEGEDASAYYSRGVCVC